MTKEELIKNLEKYDIEVNKLFKENKELKSRINKSIDLVDKNIILDEDILKNAKKLG